MASPPFEGRYVPMLAVALFALVPYILIASAATLYRDQVVQDIGASRGALSVITGLSTAGYAFGALLAGDLINRFPQRRVFYGCEALFILGWVLVAIADGTATYGTGRVLAGLATGLLLVTALPPVVQRFPPSRMPLTAAFINIAFFGAIAAGPLLGGAVAAGHIWRLLYAGFAGLGVITVGIALLSLPHNPPPNPNLPFDRAGVALGFAATAMPFLAAGELQAHDFGTAFVAPALGVGLIAFIVLMLVEYHKREALSPVRMMWTTFPVSGILVAMVGGGAFVTFVLLAVQYLLQVSQLMPLAAGLQFWPQVIGALFTAALLGVLFRTRYLPVLALSGMLVLIAGGALLILLDTHTAKEQLLVAVGLLGLGAGATVSPGLFLAAFSLPSRMLGRIFALIELVRSVADFILAPVMLKVAAISSGSGQSALTAAGIHQAMWITLLVTVAGTIGAVLLYALGGIGLQPPDLDGWIRQNRPAIASPDLAEAVRGKER